MHRDRIYILLVQMFLTVILIDASLQRSLSKPNSNLEDVVAHYNFDYTKSAGFVVEAATAKSGSFSFFSLWLYFSFDNKAWSMDSCFDGTYEDWELISF